jgi:hypothetical protein
MNMVLLVIVLLVALSAAGQPLFADDARYQWTKITTDAPFAARDGAGALSFDGRMWLIGGWNPGDKQFFPRICNNEVWSSPSGSDWTCVKPNTFGTAAFDPANDWKGRHTAGYVVHRNAMWIIGGDANQGHYQPDAWRSTDGANWTCVSDALPWGVRVLHYTVAFKDRIYVMGGQTLPQFAGGGEEHFYNDVWVSEDGAAWTKLETNEPMWSPRGLIGGSAVFKDRIWILGGGTYDTPNKPQRLYHNDVWSSPDGINWTCHLENAPWHPRQYHDVAVFDDRLWVMEGYHQDGGNRNDVWYSSDGVTWHEVPDTPWKPRHAASVFVHHGSLWMVAGNNMQPDVWRLDRRE